MQAKGKSRADQLLVARGLAESRTRAQAMIMAGLVFSGETRIEKAGQTLKDDAPLNVRGKEHPWVSRGGMKLAHALAEFCLDVTGFVCLDVGASTGGFTDVLLNKGAARVYAVDVGYGQLAQKLREDARVVMFERTNARHLTGEHIPEPVDLVVCDASFIGLKTVLDRPLDFVRPGGHLIALIKPQFEVGKDQVGKGGIVRDPALHRQACEGVTTWLESRSGWTVQALTESPITGAEGNKEFLVWARFSG